jgi:hypothetical protein
MYPQLHTYRETDGIPKTTLTYSEWLNTCKFVKVGILIFLQSKYFFPYVGICESKKIKNKYVFM